MIDKKIKDFIKLALILFLFFNIGDIFRGLFIDIGFDLNNFNNRDFAFADLLMKTVLGIVIFILYYKDLADHLREFKINLLSNIKKAIKMFGWFFLIKIAASITVIILSAILGIENVQAENQDLVEAFFASAPMVIGLSAVIYAPYIEEVIFRMGFKQAFNKKYLFIILSGVIFGIMHIVPTELSYYFNMFKDGFSIPIKTLVASMLQSVVYIAMGITLAKMYWKEPNIYFVMIIHLLNNLLGILMLLVL